MAKSCPDCGHTNEDGRIFCSACGNPLDAELRLIQDLEKNKHRVAEQPKNYRMDEDEDDYVAPVSKQDDEKKSPLPLILLGVGAVVLVVAAVLLL